MVIVSISINDDLLGEMESLKKELGYTGKSELVRAALRTLIAEKRERENLIGQVSSILIASHNEEAEEVVTGLKHRFERCINTHLHSKQESGKCLELFILKGEASDIKRMLAEFQRNRKIDYAKLVPL
jgi:CopG family transcriptional regulator, nickel-responsive regulator